MPKGPLREGYSVAYRMKLEQEFLGPIGKERLGRAPAWVRELVSRLMLEIENRHAEIRDLRGAPFAAIRKRTGQTMGEHIAGVLPRRRKPRTGGGGGNG